MNATQEADGHRAGPYVLAPGEIRRNPLLAPSVKADSRDTAGLLAVFEGRLAAPGSPGPRCTCTPAKTKRCTSWKAPCWYRSARTAAS